MDLKNKKTLFEFLRYCIIGGICAGIDLAVNYVSLFYIFGKTKDDTLYVALSVTLGFVFGIVFNYILSNVFVFRSEEQKKKGKTVKAFLIYLLVGIIGFGLTEGLTILGTKLIGDKGIWYLMMSCFVKGVVMIWNYVGRKILVYKGE